MAKNGSYEAIQKAKEERDGLKLQVETAQWELYKKGERGLFSIKFKLIEFFRKIQEAFRRLIKGNRYAVVERDVNGDNRPAQNAQKDPVANKKEDFAQRDEYSIAQFINDMSIGEAFFAMEENLEKTGDINEIAEAPVFYIVRKTEDEIEIKAYTKDNRLCEDQPSLEKFLEGQESKMILSRKEYDDIVQENKKEIEEKTNDLIHEHEDLFQNPYLGEIVIDNHIHLSKINNEIQITDAEGNEATKEYQTWIRNSVIAEKKLTVSPGIDLDLAMEDLKHALVEGNIDALIQDHYISVEEVQNGDKTDTQFIVKDNEQNPVTDQEKIEQIIIMAAWHWDIQKLSEQVHTMEQGKEDNDLIRSEEKGTDRKAKANDDLEH